MPTFLSGVLINLSSMSQHVYFTGSSLRIFTMDPSSEYEFASTLIVAGRHKEELQDLLSHMEVVEDKIKKNEERLKTEIQRKRKQVSIY